MEEKIRRLAEWARGNRAPPLTMELNITNRCNLMCRMCWLRSANIDYKNEMSDDILLRIVKEALGLGVREFRFPGSGEPLMRKNILFKLMKMIKRNGGNGLLITNGTLFSSNDVKKLILMEWDVLTISMDAPVAEINDYIRGVEGAFEMTLRTLKLIKYWKEKLGTKNPWLRMNVVLTNKNYKMLEGMIKLASEFGFEEVLLQPMTVFSEEGEKLKINNRQRDELDEHLRNASRMARMLGIHTNMDKFIENRIVERTDEMDKVILEKSGSLSHEFLSLPCFEPWYNIVIMPDGQTGPCAMFGGKSTVNAKNTSLKEIWYGNFFSEIRERLLKKKLFHFCKNCCVPLRERRFKEIGGLV